MEVDAFSGLAREGLWTLVLAVSPVVIPTLIAGLVLGMFQAATSINDTTLSFVPKLLIILLSLFMFGPLMFGLIQDFLLELFERIPDIVR
jgi:flagellar biosynthesis protein FliQ